MIYIKSIVVGLAALFAATSVYLVIWISVLNPPPEGVEVGIDFRSIINRTPSFWIVAVLAFALGFYWEYRRAS